MPKLTDIYQNGMSPEALAASVLRSQGIDIENPHLPIDPFRIMRRCGVVYQFIGAKNLEGIYLVPEDEKDVPLVGINCHRRITRQRFSAAHEDSPFRRWQRSLLPGFSELAAAPQGPAAHLYQAQGKGALLRSPYPG